MGRARQHRLRLQLHQGIGNQGKFSGGFRLDVKRHQVSVDVDRAADLIGEDVPQGVVEGFLDLRLEHLAGQFIGYGDQQGGADQALGLGEDHEATLPG